MSVVDPLNAAEGSLGTWLRPGVARALEAQVIPQLVARHRGGPLGPGGLLGARWLAGLALEADAARLPDAVLRLQQQGLSVETLQLDWLGPAAAELGRMWDSDECSFSDVTVGAVRLQCLARRLGAASPGLPQAPAPDAPRVLLGLAPGEQHGFGLVLVGEAFQRAGWDVTVVAAGGSLPLRAAAQAYDVVGVSLGGTARAGGVPALCHAIRQASRTRGVGVLLGGPLFAHPGEPLLAAPWGADAIVRDAREAVAAAAAWMTWREGSQGARSLGAAVR